MKRAADGSLMWWGADDTPGPPALVPPGVPVTLTVAVAPIKPGQSLTLEYRLDGGSVRRLHCSPAPRDPSRSAARMFQVSLPAQSAGVVEYLPVLSVAGQALTPGLGAATEVSRYQIAGPATPAVPGAGQGAPPDSPSAGRPRWNWTSRFLGGVTASLRKEVVGATPDGLRIDWHVVEGSFVGPGLDAVVLPGATDWMRIRQDGVGVVSVQACFQTRSGARIYGSYGGYFDLGADGYARALRDEFDPLPPVVVTPTYATADKQLDWLNRAQCFGVGRVDMKALRVEFDVYLMTVGDRICTAEAGSF